MTKKKNNFIDEVLGELYKPIVAKRILNESLLIQYLDKKTKSVYKSSKSRASFASIYAIYVLIKDYEEIILTKGKYKNYEGMQFSKALRTVRLLPWGEKLQNHALNSRLNEEFKKFFGTKTSEIPIRRDLKTKKYWINEKLLLLQSNGVSINLAETIIKLIDRYISLKQQRYTEFIHISKKLITNFNKDKVYAFLNSILSEVTDARLFEVISYCLLKQDYQNKGHILYRTGRTNANDGGIDFVLKPAGRFFQVTEVFNFEKYFLDIEKLLHFPITFVIKSELSSSDASSRITADAKTKYKKGVLEKYLSCFEEIITLPNLRKILNEIKNKNQVKELLDELLVQYQIEFNIKDS